MSYIELQPCPVCGAHPERLTESLRKAGGHGYPDNYSYQYRCENCGLLKGASINDIYYSVDNAIACAKLSWNAECQRIQPFVENRKNG